MNKIKMFLAVCAVFFFGGCAASSTQELSSAKEREMTVGLVQKEINVGMSQATVAEVLGSPNIVTSDDNQKETWIYDKVASEASYVNRSAGVGGGAGGGGGLGSGLILGLFTGSYSKDSGASSSTQRTLTVVIKFDKDNKVESFSYHSSKF